MDDIILKALIGGCLLASALAPLGCFVVWQRLAYFGDTLAHAALLGVAASLLFTFVPLPLSVLIVALIAAWYLHRFSASRYLSSDTLLGIFAHSALALGIVIIALQPQARGDLSAYLLGDMLLFSWPKVALAAAISLAALGLLYRYWRAFLLVTIHADIAHVEGIDVARTRLLFVLLLASVIAMSIQLVGVLLISALLIIPAAAARYLSRSPVQMALLASTIGLASVAGGLSASLAIDAPTGPLIVVLAAGVFAVVAVVNRLRTKS
jgi:zinc transport system permease protein